ncbi:homeobox protein vent1-like [Anoplopoma fimbria]|uniref:homeobox protein vent1-like n=1 Tax=Anoplopoma fimbria TaxID=229290 RepID=UPI0023EBE97A|nr:homeobox protein vent1-like [Anoplopoma fimbria]
MVKYFSVDWLAQSHHLHMAEDHGAGTGSGPTCRPHVPCMVQPRPPTFGKGYLQPKPKAARPVDSSLASPFHPANCASPISEMSGYSSGYESEAASSEGLSGLSVDEGLSVEKDSPLRRVRTKFSLDQISRLEKIFNKHKYLDAGERVKTAQKLDLTETQVRTWFQNRRMKLKREFQDYLAPQIPPVLFQPLVHQYHSVTGQRAHYPATSPAFYPLPVPQLVLQQQQMHSCGYTSGSESEVGEDSDGEAAQQGRMRTKFSSDQISKLENAFGRHKYLGAMQRRKIAEKLRLSETQVKTWFQNRRMKLKREVQDLRPEFLSVPVSLWPPLLYQLPSLSGQLPSGFYPQLQPLHRSTLPAAPPHQHRSHHVLMPPHFY